MEYYNSQFENFIKKHETNKVVLYKGFKIVRDCSVKSFLTHYKSKVILYNPVFLDRLKNSQKYFLLEWGIRSGKMKYQDSYSEAKIYCCGNGVLKSDIEGLLKTLNHVKNKVSSEDYNFSYFERTILFWVKIKRIIINIFKKIGYGK